MKAAPKYRAGSANYPGDVVAGTVGRVMGPTTYGGLVIADAASYDAETGRTRVDFVHASREQLAELAGRSS